MRQSGDGGERPVLAGAPFEAVKDIAALDAVFERSHQEAVVLFLHAPTCPIGRHAFREMDDLREPAALVNVERQRDLTRAIERRTGVQHESPQVIVLRNGEAVWDASHYDITASLVRHALEAAGRRAA